VLATANGRVLRVSGATKRTKPAWLPWSKVSMLLAPRSPSASC